MATDAYQERATELNALIDRYRDRCLWFMRADAYPNDAREALRFLGHIERHGDREAFLLVAPLKQWLSRVSSEESAA